MTHSLHRFGRSEDLTGDYIVFAMPARGFNDSDAVEKEREFLQRSLKHSPVNLGDAKKGGWYQPQKGLGPTVHWRRKTAPDPDRVIERVIRHLADPDAYPAIASEGDYIAPMPPYTRLPREELEALAVYVMSLTRIT